MNVEKLIIWSGIVGTLCGALITLVVGRYYPVIWVFNPTIVMALACLMGLIIGVACGLWVAVHPESAGNKHFEGRVQDQEIFQKVQQAYGGDLMQSYERILVFTKEMRRRYPDYNRYFYYHILIGSTPTRECDRRDFPNGEVSAFLDDLLLTTHQT